MTLLASLVVLCVVGSFSCSLAEAALYSISRARIETLRRQGHRSAQVLAGLRDDMEGPIAAILILNTALNTAVATWIGALVSERFGESWLGLFSGLFALLILLAGEIVPKNLGYKFANQVAPLIAWPVRVLVLALWPLVRSAKALTGLFGQRARLSAVPEDDIISLATMSMQGGGIRTQEARWVVNALHLDRLKARDLMTPVSVVRRVDAEMPLKMTSPDAEVWRFSRLPVFEAGDPTRIVGVVERRTVFQELVGGAAESRVREFMKPAVFVEDSTPAHAILDMFVKGRTHLFCVRDARGRWLGIVTLEDVLEALLGVEIVGEQDLYEDMQQAAREAEQAQALSSDLKRAGGIIEQAVVDAGSVLAGRPLREAGLPHDVVVGTILRDGAVVVPRGDVELVAGDRITLIGKKDDVERARRALSEPAVPTERTP
ncbi:MAG: DUF21 domain-containing protein [Elusimicrobia bacterium]|nr:DUF21 domain-containing protein [Elusimicrobiota bacterium]